MGVSVKNQKIIENNEILEDERRILKARKKRKDPETGLTVRTHIDEPDMKANDEERSYWKIMELIPDNGTHTAYQRFDVLAAYAAIGNMHKVAALFPDIRLATMQYWQQSEWWKPALFLVRERMDEELDARLTGIIDRSLSAMEDRLENGDEKLTKAGERVRVAVSFKDLSIGGVAVPFDKRALGRGDPTSRIETVSDADRLRKLQDQFKTIAPRRTINITPTREDDQNA